MLQFAYFSNAKHPKLKGLTIILTASMMLVRASDRSPKQSSKPTTTSTSTSTSHTNSTQRKVAVVLSSFSGAGTAHNHCSSSTTQKRTALGPGAIAELRSRKPDCSYGVLIGLALRAAQSVNYGDRLPVVEIYRFIA